MDRLALVEILHVQSCWLAFSGLSIRNLPIDLRLLRPFSHIEAPELDQMILFASVRVARVSLGQAKHETQTKKRQKGPSSGCALFRVFNRIPAESEKP